MSELYPEAATIPQRRLRPQANVGGWCGIAIIAIFLIVFLIYPLIHLFYDAVTTKELGFTFQNFVQFFSDPFYLHATWRSIVLGLATVLTTSILGVIIAFLLVRYDFPGRGLFTYLTIIPIIMPPLVGVLGFVFILGRAGTVNVLLMDYLGFQAPVNFMYGIHGVLLVETLHLFPLMTLNILDSLSKIDPSLEEAAESVGSRGWRRIKDITLPLTTPGFVTGALLVFIWTVSDFATPLVVGVQDLLAPQAYLNIVQFVDIRLFKMGIVISAIMVILAVVFLIAAKKYVAIKDYSSLAYSTVERKRFSPLGNALVIFFILSVLVFAFIPYFGIALDAFGRAWSLTALPESYTLHAFKRVIIETPKFIVNTIIYASGATLICLIFGVPIAWILARTKLPGRDSLDSLVTLILALPGTAIGVAYIRAYRGDIPFTETSLLGMGLVIAIVLGVRRLPYTVRGTFTSLLIVHKSFEEAAQSVGARKLRTFKDITIPLIWKGILVGSLYSFILALQESSATLLLTVPGKEVLAVGIFNFYTSGSRNEAAALGFVLLVVGALCFIIINRLAGNRQGGVFG
ncbi:MAG: iron ABC transporter permease [Smithellaceae bacterium]|nr:iron ABC transporter permease [Smithellaceae bacterium]